MSLPAKTGGQRSRFGLGGPGGILPFLRRNTILALILLLIAFVAGIEVARPGTVTPIWISNALLFAAPLGILGAGQTLVMLTGGIDLSVASVATGSAYLLATNASLGSVAAVLIGLGLGLGVGLLNGVGIAVLRVQPLVMTLGTGLMTEGVMVVYSQKMLASEPRVPEFIQALGAGKVLGAVPLDLFLWAPIAIAMIWGLRRTGFGRLTYAVGDNRQACELAGVRVWQVLLVDYVLCGFFAALAGLVLVGSTNAADLSLADVYLLPSVAAVIIGGTSILGGRGGYAGTIIGALILTVLTSLLTLLDAPEPIKQILYGAIILLLAAAYARLTD
ncbi:MAG: ABC transporter permease [Methylobacteriaceae bacterium]|nr:ABC transporter permease [Methylobacteriaceae bacterium]